MNGLQWKKELPTKPGNYLVFSNNPTAVHLMEDPNKSGLMDRSHIRAESYFNADWLGPFTDEHLMGR